MNIHSNTQLTIALICGGASEESGISLNSCRSVCDHLDPNITKKILYFNHKLEPFEINVDLLYSNTPADFEFKLKQIATPLNEQELQSFLASTDIAVPLIHGPFGEDGELQALLEKHNTPYIGASAASCKKAFDKYEAYQELSKAGFDMLPHILIDTSINENNADTFAKTCETFFKTQNSQCIVKPCRGGSSIDVYKADTAHEALSFAKRIQEKGVYTRILIEPFVEGREFTLIVLQNEKGEAVSLVPSEIEITRNKAELFDYRKKYLATGDTRYIHPPRVSEKDLLNIRSQAEAIFEHFQLSDYVRIDGWLLDDGRILFTDINCASGMEQNSFFFLQAALVGFSHQAAVAYLLDTACKRLGINYATPAATTKGKEEVAVLFGGETAERNVSIMSGTNVWLKLRRSEHYAPKPYFLDKDLGVWDIPYAFALYHTAEEITELCEHAKEQEKLLSPLREEIIAKLAPRVILEENFEAKQSTIDTFLKSIDTLFIALHGGFGEGGDLQTLCEKFDVAYTASEAKALQLCMDKDATGKFVKDLNHPELLTAKRRTVDACSLKDKSSAAYNVLWHSLQDELGTTASSALIVKPLGDGCSAGVAKLGNQKDLELYAKALLNQDYLIPMNTLSQESRHIEMPTSLPEKIIIEEFIVSDKVIIKNDAIEWQNVTGWTEITVGVYGKKGSIKALNPSITVAAQHVLTLEEKFQGGTGVNITPLPEKFVAQHIIDKVRENIAYLANKIGINGFARIDAFLEIATGRLIIIEVNAIPGLSPSTVTYHQALAEEPPLSPTALLETFLENASNIQTNNTKDTCAHTA